MTCEQTQEALTELLLARRAPPPAGWEPALRDHAWECPACAAHLRFLHALTASLAHEALPAPTPELLARSRVRAARALRAHAPAPRLGRGFGRELAAALGVLVLALPLFVGQAWLVAEAGTALLAPLLPDVVLTGLGAVYFGTFALLVGSLYAFVPLWVATVRRARTEVS